MPISVTQSDIDRWSAMITNGQRVNFYVELANRYKAVGDMDGYDQLTMQASISSYSDDWGTAAINGNAWAKSKAGSIYSGSLDSYSVTIALSTLAGVQASFFHGDGGNLSAQSMRAIDYAVGWRDSMHLQEWFPGNRVRYYDQEEGFTAVPQWVVDTYFGGDHSKLGENTYATIPIDLAMQVSGMDTGFSLFDYGFSVRDYGSIKTETYLGTNTAGVPMWSTFVNVGTFTKQNDKYTLTVTGYQSGGSTYITRQVSAKSDGTIVYFEDSHLAAPWLTEIKDLAGSSSAWNKAVNITAGSIGIGTNIWDELTPIGDSALADARRNEMGAALGRNNVRSLPSSPKAFTGGNSIYNYSWFDNADRKVATYNADGTLNSYAMSILARFANGQYVRAQKDDVTGNIKVYTYQPGKNTLTVILKAASIDASGLSVDSNGIWQYKSSSNSKAEYTFYENSDGQTVIVADSKTVVVDGEATVSFSTDGSLSVTRFNPSTQQDEVITQLQMSGNGVFSINSSDPSKIAIISNEEVKLTDGQEYWGNLSSIVGSSLGNYLASGNVLAGVLYSSTLGEIGERLGYMLSGDGVLNKNALGKVEAATAENFATDVWNRMQSAGVGVVSSMLTAELANQLGLDGFGAELFDAGGGSVVDKVLSNILLDNETTVSGIFKGLKLSETGASGNNYSPLGNLMANAIGAFLGAKLGSLLVRPETEAAVALSSIGSAVGAWAGTTGSLGLGTVAASLGFTNTTSIAFNLIMPGIGAFIGVVLGTLIGNLFGRKKPKTPTASAETTLQLPFATYEVGAWTSANGGSLSLVQYMATDARDILNGLVQQLTAGDTKALVANLNGINTTQIYGHTGSQIYVKIGSGTHNVKSADEAVEYGTLNAIRNTKVIGGDIFLKRALLSSDAVDLVGLAGDFQTAKDYAYYAANAELINGYIKQAFDSLNQADQDFYAGGDKTIVDTILTNGVEFLNSTQLARYNNSLYRAQFDRILLAVGAQTIANPWMITLLRSSELKLDQFATSDFYGGVKGFLTSFGLADETSSVHFEDVSISAIAGGGMNIGLEKLVTTTDLYGAAAQVYRLYQGLLDRAPDGYGLTDYTNYIQLGVATLEDVASSIISSQEFINRVGANLSDWDFVVQLYATVQNRGATNAEIQSWVDTIDNGASRAQVAVGFTESNEYVNNSASFIQSGLTYTSHAHQDFFTVLSQSIGWDDELVIDQVSQVGLTSSSGVTTNNSDFVDMSASATGVTVNDWRQVTVNGSLQWQSGGDNIFIGSAGNDTLAGGTGSDWLMGSGGYDIMWGGEGNDVLINPNGGGELHGEAGDDYIMGGWGYGDDGNDTMVGRAGYDSLVGGNGDDLFLMAKDYSNNWYVGGLWATNSDPNGSDTLSAERLDVGVGFDIDYRPADWNGNSDLTLADAASRSVNLYNWATGQWLSVMNVNSIENATGSLFGDLIYGTTGDNVLRGLAGNDTLYGRAGDDVIEGGAGADTLYGGDGKDVLSYENSSEAVFVDMSTRQALGGDAAGDVFSEFESVRGSKFADYLKGDSSTNVIEGLDGDDWIVATAGGTSTTITIPDYNDWHGYGGPRQITYWTGGDVYNGGSGNDTVDYSEATSGVTAYLGSYTISNSANTATAGTGSAGLAQGHTYISIESIVGSNYSDSLSAGAGAQSFEGGGGNDFLSGGAGADTYYFGRGDGSDTVTETNADNNTVVLGANITVSDMYNPTSGGSSGFFDVGIRGTSDIIRFSANFADLGNNRLKTISFNGQSSLDVSNITYQPSGATGYNDALNGWADQADLVQGFEGNDVLTGSGTSSESKGNIFIGGTGNDTLTASVGDDQYAYDRGDGIDTITDSGGDDTIVFGSTVAADDVVFKVVGNDLYIGLKDKTNTALTADQVSERIKIVNGGVQYKVVDGNDQTTVYSTTLNTIEYVQVGGTTMDLTKLNIDWTVQTTWQYGDTYPIVLDLGGDGLNLTAVEDSDIIVKTAQGGLSRLGWASAADAFLAVDRDGDGAINKLSEISFAQDKEGATSDLEGLKTWDTNGDGILNASDENFEKILVWQDLNQNGRSTAQELRTLSEAGIIGIDLNGTATGYTPGTVIDNYVQNNMGFIWADGSRGDAYDVALARHVLGTDGLYAGEYQAEWGARDEDGSLGRLLNDPETVAKAALVSQRRTAVEDIVASYDEVSLKARVDFTDTDEVSAEVAERIGEMNHSERAAWLSGQTTTVDDKIRLMSSARTIAVQLDQAEQATDDLVSTGLDLASASVSGSGTASSNGGNNGAQVASVQANGAGVASDLGVSLTASEPISGVVNAATANGLDNAWWRQQTLDVANGVTSLGALMASMYGPTVTAVGSGPEGGIVDDTLTRQQLILLQSMAGFGSGSGGEVAVWQRTTSAIQQPLAASSGVRGVSQDAGAALVA